MIPKQNVKRDVILPLILIIGCLGIALFVQTINTNQSLTLVNPISFDWQRSEIPCNQNTESCNSSQNANDAGQDNIDSNDFPDTDPAPSFQLTKGVNSPRSVSQQVSITNDRILYYYYKTILNREPDEQGFRLYLGQLTSGEHSRSQVFNSISTADEAISNISLANKSDYIKRLYTSIYNRTPTSEEIDYQEGLLKNRDGSGSQKFTWYELLNAFLALPEYSAVSCKNEVYDYGQKILPTSATFKDLYDGTAQLASRDSAESLSLTFNPQDNVLGSWDEKVQTIYSSGTYYAIVRGYIGEEKFNLFLMTSTDGLNFVSQGPLFQDNTSSYYDPYVYTDNSSCPTKYYMVMECANSDTEHASVCFSQTSDITKTYTWSPPKLILEGCDHNQFEGCDSTTYLTASTPTLYKQNDLYYLAVTNINDSSTYPFTSSVKDDGDESTYSVTYQMGGQPDKDLGYANRYGEVILDALPLKLCDSDSKTSWDCNNADKQDIHLEGDGYVVLYNGANYYRCIRPSDDTETSIWGIGMAYSLGSQGFTKKTSPLLMSFRDNTCGVSYPVANAINGELYIYYAEYGLDNGNTTKRLKLIKNN